MATRTILLTHLFAGLSGLLLGLYLGTGNPDPDVENPSIEEAWNQVEELKARVLSFEEIKQRLDGRIALLLAQKQVVPQPVPSVEPTAPLDPPLERPSAERLGPTLAFDDGVYLANYRAMASGVLDLITQGEFDAATETIEYLEEFLQTMRSGGPGQELGPLYQEAIENHWVPQLFATLIAEPDPMLQYALMLREKERSGEKIGSMVQFLAESDSCSLALLGGGDVSSETLSRWLDELEYCSRSRGLKDSEIAALSYMGSPRAVDILELDWTRGSDAVEIISSLVQINTPESRNLLQELLLEIKDEKLAVALEVWLQRN
ncbi:MAG TPA: hypothetical protein EYQ08_01550 [Planctomycetes bacterium]|nr:hypothetical protein [Planctomycetota bacterium]HIK81552.1 hypothetical protein [Planctomycetota bacterium]